MRGPFLFADWRVINTVFCLVMWGVVLVLTVVVLAHTGDGSPQGVPGRVSGAPHLVFAR